MSRPIDAEILFEKVGNIKPKNRSEYDLIGKFMNMITYSPTIERPHGEWLECKDDNFCKCSECYQIVMSEERSNFCPNCGSDNRKREGEASEE